MPGIMLTASTSSILTDVGGGLTEVISWIGQVINALVGSDGALAPIWPLVGVSIGISILLFGIKVMKGFTWGM